jgi:hypothetical protein
MTRRKEPDHEAVRREYAALLAPATQRAIALERWQRLSKKAQRDHQAESFIAFQDIRREALNHLMRRYRLEEPKLLRIVEPLPLPDPWFLRPLGPSYVKGYAQIKTEVDRPTSRIWREAAAAASRAIADIERGDAAAAVESSIRMMQHVIRAELMEGPAPLIEALRARPKAIAAEGGAAKRKPAWWGDAQKYARTLLATGRQSHELAGLVARKFKKSEDAARRCLKGSGILVKKSRGC